MAHVVVICLTDVCVGRAVSGEQVPVKAAHLAEYLLRKQENNIRRLCTYRNTVI